MVYNPPRPGKGKRKSLNTPRTTPEEDKKFFEDRYRELKRSYDATDIKDESRRAYYGKQMRSIDRKLHPENYDQDGKLIKPTKKPRSEIRHFGKGVDGKGKPYISTGEGEISGSIMGEFGNVDGD